MKTEILIKVLFFVSVEKTRRIGDQPLSSSSDKIDVWRDKTFDVLSLSIIESEDGRL